MALNWIACGDHWCNFKTVKLESVKSAGVYIIWHEGAKPRTVYVGQGNVADRITDHRTENNITKYAKEGIMKVTWARVPAKDHDGVEAYVANELRPLEGDKHPDVPFIKVNLPWS